MRNPIRPTLSVLLVLVVAACSGGAATSPSQPAGSASGAPSATPGGSGAAPTSPEEAAALVLASDPRFARFGPKNPDAIGQCCWYAVTQNADGYQVLVHAGWGDCPSGCIEKHEWTFNVSSAGAVTLIGESGDDVPSGGIPQGGS